MLYALPINCLRVVTGVTNFPPGRNGVQPLGNIIGVPVRTNGLMETTSNFGAADGACIAVDVCSKTPVHTSNVRTSAAPLRTIMPPDFQHHTGRYSDLPNSPKSETE